MHRRHRIVLLAGEPGVGKTRLADRFAREVLERGAPVLLGRCWEEPLAPFEPYAEALRQVGAADVLQPGQDPAPARATGCSTRSTRRSPGSPPSAGCCW